MKRRLRCRECPRAYSRERDRVAHEVQVHHRLPPSMCRKCRDTGWATEFTLKYVADYGDKGVVAEIASSRPVECPACQRGQVMAVVHEIEGAA